MENAQAADGETGSLCRGCVIHTIFGKQYNDGTPLGEYETRLEGEQFYRVHKTSLVHLKYVDSIFPWTGNALPCECGERTPFCPSAEIGCGSCGGD